MNQQKCLLCRGVLRRPAVLLAPPTIRGLDDPLFISENEVVNIDPSASVLPDVLDNTPRLADDATDFSVGTEDAKEGRDGADRRRPLDNLRGGG